MPDCFFRRLYQRLRSYLPLKSGENRKIENPSIENNGTFRIGFLLTTSIRAKNATNIQMRWLSDDIQQLIGRP